MNTKEKLDKITELEIAQRAKEMEKEKLIDQILTPEIKAKIADIEAEFAKDNHLAEEIERLTGEVKSEVLSAGETVKGQYLMAVYNKGRVSWDTKALDGYAAAHPEVAQFKKIGEPSVSIRGI